jgi:hypothetical protein
MALCGHSPAAACIERLVAMILSVFQMVPSPEMGTKSRSIRVPLSDFSRSNCIELGARVPGRWRGRHGGNADEPRAMRPGLHRNDRPARPNKSRRKPQSRWRYLPKVGLAECSPAAGIESQISLKRPNLIIENTSTAMRCVVPFVTPRQRGRDQNQILSNTGGTFMRTAIPFATIRPADGLRPPK